MATTFIAQITDKNMRLYIDKKAREAEGLKPGDYVRVTIEKVPLEK